MVGISLIYALRSILITQKMLIAAIYLVVVLLGGGLALIGLFATEFPTSKLFNSSIVREYVPQLITNIVHRQPRGGIHPNEMAGALILVLPLSLSFLLSYRHWRSELVTSILTISKLPEFRSRCIEITITASLWMVFALMTVIFILSQSRSAFTGIVFGLLIIASHYISLRTAGFCKLLVICLSMLMFTASLGFVAWLLTYLNAVRSDFDSFPSRLELWERTFSLLQDFPFTGIGPGQTSLVLHTMYTPLFIAPQTYIPHVHNFFLQIGVDYGILALVSFMFAIFSLFLALIRIYRANANFCISAIVIGIISSLVSFMVFGLTDAISIGARGALPFWVLLGLASAIQCSTSNPWLKSTFQNLRVRSDNGSS